MILSSHEAVILMLKEFPAGDGNARAIQCIVSSP